MANDGVTGLNRGPDWRLGCRRLAALLAGLAAVGLGAWALIVWSFDRHVILAGMLLLLGGYLTLGGVLIAADWIKRGFHGQ
ncbi:MAG: hypothetical protein VCD33_09425 [Alphaproteobacteria bacterium]